jgi:regulator of sirC expression with transglutaminase-like and TPR domain
MSNETKRDVFVKLAEDVKITDSFDEEYPKSQEDIEKEYKENIHNYDTALPDDLPVIPKAVGEFIKAMKANGDSLFASESTVLLMEYLGLIPFDALKITEWIDKHQNTVARAWLLETWAVEETGEIVKLEAEK